MRHPVYFTLHGSQRTITVQEPEKFPLKIYFERCRRKIAVPRVHSLIVARRCHILSLKVLNDTKFFNKPK